MDPKVADIVNQLKPYHPEKIILFGSYAYGQPHDDSDVDLILIKRTKEPFLDRMVKIQSLLRTTTPVDAFVFTPEEFERAKDSSLVVHEAVERGKVIYG